MVIFRTLGSVSLSVTAMLNFDASASLRPEALCSRVVRLSVRLSVCRSVLITFFLELEGKTGRGVIKGCGGFKTNWNKKAGGV